MHIVVIIPVRCRKSLDTRGVYVSHPLFRIIMHQHRDFAYAELVGEVAVVIGVAVRVNAGLDGSDNVRVFGGDNCSEEDVRSIP